MTLQESVGGLAESQEMQLIRGLEELRSVVSFIHSVNTLAR